MILKFETNLNCQSCISKVKPFLDEETSISQWSVDINDARKVLSVEGKNLEPGAIIEAVAKSGFKVLRPFSESSTIASVSTETYKPLILIFLYLLGGVLLLQLRSGFAMLTGMQDFMGGFFLIFSFFKFLNLRKFADAYATYDVIAKRWSPYGLAYPFIELSLGVLFVSGLFPLWTNIATFLIMGVSTVGVVKALNEKRTIECACLGTVFNLPMTKVTLFEDLLMTFMALGMIFQLA